MHRRIAIAATTLTLALGGLGFAAAQEGQQEAADPGEGGGCATPAASPAASPVASPDASPEALLECATPAAGTPTS